MSEISDIKNVSDILPYDFVRENEVIASFNSDGYEILSPNKISADLYHEIQRYLKSSFMLPFVTQIPLTNFLPAAFLLTVIHLIFLKSYLMSLIYSPLLEA